MKDNKAEQIAVQYKLKEQLKSKKYSLLKCVIG